jgi:hypothetical protein
MSERRVGKRGEQKRRWDLENRRPCVDCGGLVYRPHARCARCRDIARRTQREQRRIRIAALWNDGATLRGIAEALDSTPPSIGVEMAAMRKAGWALPYRRTGPAQPGKYREQVAA